jgi:hypothetical protein
MKSTLSHLLTCTAQYSHGTRKKEGSEPAHSRLLLPFYRFSYLVLFKYRGLLDLLFIQYPLEEEQPLSSQRVYR